MRARGGLIQRSRARGFSRVELVIVVVINGVDSAVAVPRISGVAKGSKGRALKASAVNTLEAI